MAIKMKDEKAKEGFELPRSLYKEIKAMMFEASTEK